MKPKIEIINDLLGYEGLKIIQRPDIFNFSLDSTILADFVTINLSCKSIMDLGCGNGYIPIFLTLRTKAKIYGIDIQPELVDLAKRSVDLNQLQDQITINEIDIKLVKDHFLPSSFDVVVSNPPYFEYLDTSLVNDTSYKTIARHEVYIKLEDILKQANYLLKDGGTFAMVHRADRLIEILFLMRKYHLEPKRLRFVYPKESSNVSQAILIEGKKSIKQGGLEILAPLYVLKGDGVDKEYTKEILAIFNYKSEAING